MSWTKSALQMSLIVIFTIVLLDVVAYLGFREQIQSILPGYGVTISNFDRGYPRYHFSKDDALGFDITPKFKTTTSTKPEGYKTYDVWGNSFGCFDDEWGPGDQQGGIYLAGDSFTWGYVSHGKKFSTLLEDMIARPVYGCGVTHTGQRHQFEKFKRLFERGINPSVVVVNVVWNDINNDFFFPHSTVVDGYMVETVEQCGYHDQGNYSFNKRSHEEAANTVNERLNAPVTIKSILRDYSVTANILITLLRAAQNTAPTAEISTTGDGSAPASALDCRVWLYGGAYETLGPDYSQSELSSPNREALSGWIVHASEHNYMIVFSLIPAETTDTVNYSFIKDFIETKGGLVVRFDEFIKDKALDKTTLYHPGDEHFNEIGNAQYAEFLRSELTERDLLR